jgi:DNA (cytosine-5)-methyltransferase 1
MGFDTKEKPFRIGVSDTQAYKQFGNSVVVPVVKFIAEAVRPHIEAAVLRKQPALKAQKRMVTRPDRAERAAAHG